MYLFFISSSDYFSAYFPVAGYYPPSPTGGAMGLDLASATELPILDELLAALNVARVESGETGDAVSTNRLFLQEQNAHGVIVYQAVNPKQFILCFFL